MERQLPADIDAERACLGALLIDRDAIVVVAPWLFAEYFYLEKHAWVYEAILECYNRRIPPDVRTVSDRLRSTNRLEPIGGVPYLVELSVATPTAVHIEYYARVVERTALLRRLIQAGGQIAALGFNEAEELEATLDKAEETLFNVSQRKANAEFIHIGQVVDSFFEQINHMQENRGEVTGLGTAFRDLDELTGGLQKSDLIILAARPSVGKCLTANTLIDDPLTGERRTIAECVARRQASVYGVAADGSVRPTAISDWIDSGIKPCYRVTTRTGRSVEVTGHHPFLTVLGWQPLHNLGVGSCIAVPRRLPVFGTDTSWPLELVRLLAYFIAEGGLTDSSPEFTNTDPMIVEDFKNIIATHFPTCTVRQQKITYIVSQLKAAYHAQHTRNPVTSWLRELGLWGKLAREKAFPPCVWRWDGERLALFLRVLMSCDGTIYQPKDGYQRIELTVASQQLASDVHHALVRFGITGKFYQTTTGAWRVEVTDPAAVRVYQEQIGWIGEKATRHPNSASRISKVHSNKGHIPRDAWSLVRTAATAQQLSLMELARGSGETTAYGKRAGYNLHTQRNIPRYRMARYAEVLAEPGLQMVANDDLYWDEIRSIEPLGEQQVYDLTVPDGANFIANDICVHNTAYSLQLAYNVALHSRGTVGIFSLEMSREQLVQRILAMHTGIDSQKLRSGHLRDSDLAVITEGMGVLSSLPLYIDDTPGLTIAEVRSKSRRLQADAGVDLIIIDYLQLMQGRARDNRVNEIGEISRGLKALARELNVPVIALSQLSRAVETRTSHVPMLSDLRESGCLAGESLVYLPDEGIYRRIDELVGQVGFNVLALNTETWQLEPRPVLNAFATGCKPVWKLTTRLGRSIRATANHKFLTINGWRRLDELNNGDRLALPRTLPGPHAATLSDDELALLGHLIGDGCTLARQPIHYTTNELALAELVAELATRVFGDKVTPRISQERQWYQVYLAASEHLTHGKRNPIAAWLDALGIFDLRSHEKRVPEAVFRQPAQSIAHFLRHLWATDGCIHLSIGKKHYAGIYYASSSKELAQHVTSLLLRLGINTTLRRTAQPGKGRDQYHVIVSGKADIEAFFAQVGALGANKVRHQAAIAEQLASKVANTNRDVLPRDIWRVFAVPAMQEAGLTSRQMQAQLGNAYCGTALYKQNLSRERAARLAQVVHSPKIASLAQSDVYWDEIISIEPDGEAEVYDLTVEGLHNFVVNDTLSHNSIEQDADIVIFIYREEIYDPNTDKAGIAELHIAKHRNGPVGVVPLRFDKSINRFVDLERYRQPEGY